MGNKLRNWWKGPWPKGFKIATLLIILALVVAVALLSTVARPERVVIVEDELRQQELEVCQNQSIEKDRIIAGLQEELVELTTAPNISVEKWVKVDGSCCGWQKEISAEKGDWIEVKVVVNVTGTMDHVWVRDAALAGDPWTRIQELQVDGIPFDGDVAEGISLGKLTNETKEITFKAQLSKSTYRYSCGENIIENRIEAGDCGFETAASEVVQIMVDIHCAPSSGGGGGKKDDEAEGPTVITH